jgi:hypothetical protein
MGQSDVPVDDLGQLIRTMEPTTRCGEFVFVEADRVPIEVVTEASVWEPEGRSAVITRDLADELGLEYDFVAGWITLTVPSSLNAVGLTAAVSSELARHGIACNVIAGLRHDHLLVPVERVEQALTVLQRLANVG